MAATTQLVASAQDQDLVHTTPPVKEAKTPAPIDPEIQAFLEGHNPLQYVANVEVPYNQSVGELFVHEPGKAPRIEKVRYRPFVYIRDLKKAGRPFYQNDPKRRSDAMAKHRITIKKVRVTDANGAVNERLANGYCYQVFSDSGNGQQGLMNFFREGGISVWDTKPRTARFELTPPTAAPTEDELYTGLAGQDGCELLFNHVTMRYEVHVEAKFVNTRSQHDEQGDEEFFIRLKAEGKDTLKLEQDFDFYYDEANEKYVLSLLPEAEKPRKIRKRKDGTEYEVPTVAEEIERLSAELVDVTRIDHPLVVARMPEVFTHPEGPVAWCEECVAQLRAEGLWSKVQDRERASYVKERKRLTTQNNRVNKKLQTNLDKQKAAPSRKANTRDPRYTINKLVVEYSVGFSDFFYTIKPVEQLLIQHGIRLFKGYDQYKDVPKLDFDLETTGLFPQTSRVFLIGARTNMGWQKVFRPTKLDDDRAEADMILDFLAYLGQHPPAVFKGFNSENFDFDFLQVRCELLGIPFEIPGLWGKNEQIQRKPGATLKLGGEAEVYTQTIIRGVNVIDIMHAARRVKAVTSDMERYSLKYVCQYEKIAKPNRVYVAGDRIYKLWEENALYYANRETNEYELVQGEAAGLLYAQQVAAGFPGGYEEGENPVDSMVKVPLDLAPYGELTYLTTGRALVYQYLLDDLWETDRVDDAYNEDRFQMAKWMPTGFARTCTMGGSTAWNLMMTAWSYENGLAVPYRQKKYKFTGGLSRTFRLGKFGQVKKVDFSGLYPSLKLQYDVFPMHDVLGVQRRLLHFFTLTRGIYKKIAGDESLPELERNLAKARSGPLKINNNSEFGSGGSFFYYWNFMEGAWETTCRGRQFLRGMVAYFMRYGCVPTVLDTDGVNFEVPELLSVDLDGQPVQTPYPLTQVRYVDLKGREHADFAALVEKYNDDILGQRPYMKLDLEADWPSAINISRKNYANLEAQKDPKKPPKIKFVGNSIKDNNMPAYIKEFVQKGLRLLLNDQGYEFVEAYYQQLTKIYLMQIPLRQIAKKGKVKMTPAQYQNRGTNKNGQVKARQAHMELVIQEKLKVDLGEAVYFVSTGKKKAHTESTIDKVTGKLMASVYREEDLERDPDLTVEYNVERYIDAFNAKVKLLLVCFPEHVRETLLKVNPADRNYYTEADLGLINYENPKDPLSEFFTMEASEVRFWNLSGLDPYEMFADFTADAAYDGHHYARKLKGVQQVMAAKGRTVRCYRERYANGDLVLGFERTVMVADPETGEKTEAPAVIQPYLLNGISTDMGLPFNNQLYAQLRKYRTLYGPHTLIEPIRRYPLSEVQQGELVLLRMLYDPAPQPVAEPA
jgi:DNA polymerase elongation subunit (family B)